MGRGKIEIRRIEKASSRQVTFAKRRVGLVKKAQELSILCDADVALLIFSSSGKRFEFASPSSSSVEKIVEKYMKYKAEKDAPNQIHPRVQDWIQEMNDLATQVGNLKSACLFLKGEGIRELNLQDLNHLENQMNMALGQVRAQKGQLLLQSLDDINNREQKLHLENKDLKEKIASIQKKILRDSQQTIMRPSCVTRDPVRSTPRDFVQQCPSIFRHAQLKNYFNLP